MHLNVSRRKQVSMAIRIKRVRNFSVSSSIVKPINYQLVYQKNTIMSQFVKELNEEVDELERKIEEKKKEIQMYSTKGATNDNQRREMKIVIFLLYISRCSPIKFNRRKRKSKS